MEVGYKKDLRHNYMIIGENPSQTPENFSIRMLERQNISGLLPVEQKLIDNRALLYYDITGKQAVTNIIDKISLSYERIKELCSGIIRTIEESYEYLLLENDFILTPEFIYIDISSYTPGLCYLPGYGKCIKEQMSRLLEYLMNKVDYNDKEAVYLVYQLYAVSKEEGCTFGHLKEVLDHPDRNEHTLGGGKADIKNNPSENINRPVNTGQRVIPANKVTQGIKEKATNSKAINDKVINKIPSENNEIPVVMEKIEGETEITCYSLKTLVYAGSCVMTGILTAILCFITKIIYNSIGTRIDYSKLFALLLIILCVEGYLLNKLFDKKNKITKMVKTKEYIDPREDYGYQVVSINTDKKVIAAEAENSVSQLSKDRNLKNSNNESQNNLNQNFEKQNNVNRTNIPEKHIPDVNNGDYEEDDNEYEPTCLLNASAGSGEGIPILKAQDESKYKTIPITSLPFFIGKLKKNVDFCLESDTVSRYHAKITKEGEAYFLTDLNSTNGTYVNKELLPTYQKKEIKFGDELAFADIKYRFLQEGR